MFDLYVKPASGAGDEELLVKSPSLKSPTSWSSDGRFLLYNELDPTTRLNVWALPFGNDGKPMTPIPLIATEFIEGGARFSLDMRWIAYVSNASGRSEVYVRPFDPAAPSAPQGAIPVSKDGGVLPRWRHDGKELVFQSPAGALMSVEVSAGATFRPSVPRQLFVLSLPGVWDMSRDGQKFLVPIPTDTTGNAPITVVMNWTSGLAR